MSDDEIDDARLLPADEREELDPDELPVLPEMDGLPVDEPVLEEST